MVVDLITVQNGEGVALLLGADIAMERMIDFHFLEWSVSDTG